MRSKASLSLDSKASLSLGVVIMALSAWAVVSAFGWPWKAALFPLAIGIPMFLLAGAEVLWVILGSAHRGGTKDFQLSQHLPARVTLRRTASVMAWTLGFFAAIVLLGFQIAVPLLVFPTSRLRAAKAGGCLSCSPPWCGRSSTACSISSSTFLFRTAGSKPRSASVRLTPGLAGRSGREGRRMTALE